jgi:LytS/YehU family sensor histidine kinase
VGLLAFNLLWYVVIAYTLASAALLSGAAWMPVFLSGPALHWQAMTGAVLYVAIAASSYTVQATREAQAAAALLHQAEVHALRAQLDPHLLFNTLHSLLELVRSGDTRADDAIDRFARVARYVSDGRRPDRDVVPLASEWQMTQDYVALERLRLGDRLHCRFDLGDDLTDVSIPALSLQPLVENAIRHGIAPRPGAGQVIIAARRHVDQVTLTVLDDGLGVTAATHGSGTGLDLVRRRLHGCFGTALHFAAGPRTDGDGWLVSATFPASRTA